jgi:hypothetical protein
MADLLDMYKQGAFSKDEDENQEVDREKEDSEEETEKKDNISINQVLMDVDMGRDFFGQYLNLLMRKKREEASMDFRVDDLFINQSESDNASERKEKEEKFLTGRKKDFVKYVNILNSLVKLLDD